MTGALHAPAIFIDRGVLFEGTCKMAPLDDEVTATEGVEPPQPAPARAADTGQAGAAEPEDDAGSPRTWTSGTRTSRPGDDP